MPPKICSSNLRTLTHTVMYSFAFLCVFFSLPNSVPHLQLSIYLRYFSFFFFQFECVLVCEFCMATPTKKQTTKTSDNFVNNNAINHTQHSNVFLINGKIRIDADISIHAAAGAFCFAMMNNYGDNKIAAAKKKKLTNNITF